MGRRKKRPQPPKYFWYDTDGCWFCKKKNACGGCKVMKEIVAEQKEKQKQENGKQKNTFKKNWTRFISVVD